MSSVPTRCAAPAARSASRRRQPLSAGRCDAGSGRRAGRTGERRPQPTGPGGHRLSVRDHQGGPPAELGRGVSEAGAQPARICTVLTDTLAHRVLFDGRRAVGVAAARGGEPVQYRARARGDSVGRCAAVAEAPAAVRDRGRRSTCAPWASRYVVDSPDVGSNMREHRLLFIQHRLKGRGSLNGAICRAAAHVQRAALPAHAWRRHGDGLV